MPKSTSSNNSMTQNFKTDRNDATMIQQMQAQADHFTRMFEWENRNEKTLESTANSLFEQIQKVKQAIADKEKDCKTGDTKKSRIRSKNLQKDIDILENKQNETIGEIEKLKRAIQLLRSEKTLYKNNLQNMENEIRRAHEQTQRLYQDIEFGQNNSKTSQNFIMDLKARNNDDKEMYEERIKQLNKSLREPRGRSSRDSIPAEKLMIPLDTSTALKQRLMKLISGNKEKIKLIDSYQKNMKIIDESFSSIMEATGISDIQEIQNIFIKGQQQNYGLLSYVDVLNQEIDNLIYQNEQLKSRIEAQEKENAEREEMLQDPSDDNKRIAQLKKVIEKKRKQAQQFQDILNEVQPTFQQLMIRLSKSKFNTKNKLKSHEYETGGVNLNETTFDNFLSEMEEYTNQLLYFKGKVSDEPNSEIFAKTLMIDEVPIKDFRKRVLEIATIGPATSEDPQLNRQLLDGRKFREMAHRDIEKHKSMSMQERPKKK